VAKPSSYLIPNLSQGVSQQADAQRDPTQAEAQVNAVSSLSEGLRKRDCTVALAQVFPSIAQVTVEVVIDFINSDDATITFVFTRTAAGVSSPLEVLYEISGSAVPADYTSDDIVDAPAGGGLKVATIASGELTAEVQLLALGWVAKSVTFTIVAEASYEVGTPDEATAIINPD
jgi:hypothetical protein